MSEPGVGVGAGTGVDVHVYRVPATPECPEEWRDAVAVSGERRAFALCDGASSAFRAGPWARLLAREYVTEGPDHSPESLVHWVDRCREKWSEREAERRKGNAAAAVMGADGQETHRRPADFWLEDAEARGVAKATFLGMRLRPAPEGWSFEAVAVGDSCLLHLRGDALLRAFPLGDAALFGSHPDLLSAAEPLAADRIHHYRGRLDGQDTVLLVSDALAETLLTHGHTGAGPGAAAWWQVVRQVDEPAFERLVTELREARAIERDDTTMIRIRPRPEH